MAGNQRNLLADWWTRVRAGRSAGLFRFTQRSAPSLAAAWRRVRAGLCRLIATARDFWERYRRGVPAARDRWAQRARTLPAARFRRPPRAVKGDDLRAPPDWRQTLPALEQRLAAVRQSLGPVRRAAAQGLAALQLAGARRWAGARDGATVARHRLAAAWPAVKGRLATIELPPALPEASPRTVIATAWADPARRPWLLAGMASVAVLLALVVVGPDLTRRYFPARAERAAPPAAVEPTPPGEQAPPAPPAAEGQPPAAQPPPAPGQAARVTPTALGLAALPLLLGLFWLLSAWLVDAEARRAFVIQEPWGERRTVAYSC